MSLSNLVAAPARVRPQGSFIEAADGTRLSWRAWGEGPPIVFVHSWAMAAEMWDYQFAHFAEAGFRCIAYDRRGHGRSDVAQAGYDIDTLADDLATVIEALDLTDLTVVGHSMGCNEIARCLTRHGDARIAKIVFLAPVTPCLTQRPDNPNGAPDAYFEATRGAWRRNLQQWLAENTDAFFVPETSEALKRWAVAMIARTPLPVAIACSAAFTGEDFRPDVRAIARPTLVLHGDADASAPLELTGRATAALIPQAELKVYPGAPHGLMYTHQDQVNADVLSFVRGMGAGG